MTDNERTHVLERTNAIFARLKGEIAFIEELLKNPENDTAAFIRASSHLIELHGMYSCLVQKHRDDTVQKINMKSK